MRTVAGVDKVVVLSKGIVTEQDTPEKLMAQEGIYKRMVELQNKSGNWVLNNH